MKKINCKISLLALAVTIILSNSCRKDFLEQQPASSLNALTYYKNVDELESGLDGCYGALQSHWFEITDWMIGDIGSDDADKGSTADDMYDLTPLSYSQQDASNGIAWNAWYVYYTIIAKSNVVIDKSSGTKAGTQEDSIAIRKIVNQARFIRALCYYHLVTDFGDVPLVNKFLNPDELNLKRVAATDIWAQIESDLIDATYLPTKNEWNQKGRITSGAAWAILGKVYLTEKKYELANDAFYQVVNSDQYKLMDDFGKVFSKDDENCDESIFEIQHSNGIHYLWETSNWEGNWRMPRDFGAGGFGFDCPTNDLLHEFEAGDPRIIYTFMFPGDLFPASDGSSYTVENQYSPTGYNCRKFWIPWSERTGLNWYDWDINYRYMRYSEVLLLYAESLNEVNNPAAALNLLNQVRARARNTPNTDLQRISCAYPLTYSGELLPEVTTTDQNALRQAIWHEQRVELATEGKRRNILLRTNRFIDRMGIAKKYANVTVLPYQLLLPIPEQEIELSNHLLVQNPGY